MQMKPIRTLLATAVLGCLVLAGCTSRVDASSEAAVRKSVAALAAHAPSDIRGQVDEAAKRYLAVYFGDAQKPSSAPEWFVVDKMDPAQFVRYVQHFLKPQDHGARHPPEEPDRFITRQYLASLDIAKTQLEQARDKAHVSGNYTVDQFEWKKPTLVPPDPNEPMSANPVTFEIPFVNNSGFDVFHVAFRVIIKFPGMDYASFDQVLTDASDKPIPTGVPSTVTLTCCTSQEAEAINRELRAPPKGTQFEYALVGLADYGKKQALDNAIFPQASFDELNRIQTCLADVEKQGDAWVPSKAAPACREHDDLMAIRATDEPVHRHRE
jgi:outer membrane murein-binding lipoprotein Lpp